MWNEITKFKINLEDWNNQFAELIPIDNPRVDHRFGDQHTIYFDVTENKQPVARFAYSFMHGCKGVLISHSILVHEPYRKLGIGKAIQKINNTVAEGLRVSCLIATVVDNNENQLKTMKNWEEIDSFKNKRTGNNVKVLVLKT